MKIIWILLVFVFHSTQSVNFAGSQNKLISIDENPGYRHILKRLQKVMKDNKFTGEGHFFATNYNIGDPVFYMFWKEGKAVWILSIGADDYEDWRSIEFPSGGSYIDLIEDVVTDKNKIGSSTYLVDKEWISKIIYDAVVYGHAFTVNSK